MGASESYLSEKGYGYDYVVAVTQESINATALAFLSSQQPTVDVCFIAGEDGHAKLIDHRELVAKAKGSDPFLIPASGPERDQAITNLDEADFLYGFSAAMGIPAGFPATTLPDLVTLGATASDKVVYRLLCRSFLIVNLLQRRHNTPVWESWSQPVGPAGQPWLFTYQVPLISPPVNDTKAFVDSAAFANLPASTQQQVAAKPEDFTIQHLLFDFAHASEDTRPQITGTVDPELLEKLYAHFSIAYFEQLAAVSMPLVAIVPVANDPFAGLRTKFSISPNATDPRATTLNYLCTAAGNPLQATKPFTWSWVEPNQLEAFDGVCVLNRTHLVHHLERQLAPYVEANSWIPHPVYLYKEFAGVDAGFSVVDRRYDWGRKPAEPPVEIEAETLDRPATGDMLLRWLFKCSRKNRLLPGIHWMWGDTAFELTVRCRGNVTTVEQHVLVNCDLGLYSSQYGAKVIDITKVDTITLAVGADGALVPHQESVPADHSDTIVYHSLVPKLKEQLEASQQRVRDKVNQAFVDFPLQLADQVIFPGGKGFLFKDVFFSDHQDLVAHITYADPS